MNTNKVYKKYKLLKDLPKSKAGSIFTWNENMKAYTNDESIWMHQYEVFGKLEDNDWFSEIKEENKSNDSFQWDDRAAEAYRDTGLTIDDFKNKWHKCKHCGAWTTQPDEQCWNYPNTKPQVENKPEWEIVAYASKFLGNGQVIFTKDGNGEFSAIVDGKVYSYTEERFIKEGGIIKSVLRRDDGQVFSVGDEVESFQWANQKIIGFIIGSDNTMIVEFETCRNPLSKIKKLPPQPQKEEQGIKQWEDKFYWMGKELIPIEKVDSMCEDAFDMGREMYAGKWLYKNFKDYQNSKQKQ